MVAKSAVTVENADSPTAGLLKNKLTQCFDDMLRLSTEMLVQEQLKTIQLDNRITHGFPASQQRALKERFHAFQTILDDVDITLRNGSDYVEALARSGAEKEQLRIARAQEEREAKEKAALAAKEKEERETKEKEEREAKEKAEREAKEKEEREAKEKAAAAAAAAAAASASASSANDNPLDLMDDMKLSFNDDDGTAGGDSKTNDILDALAVPDSGTKGPEPVAAASGAPGSATAPAVAAAATAGGSDADKNLGANSVFNDLDSMDMSLFTDLDNTNFDSLGPTIGADNTNNNNNNNNNNNSGGEAKNPAGNDNNTANPGNAENNTSAPSDGLGLMDPLQDMGDDYLTLNDFNDLNIDWNAGGDAGELDLNSFNI